MKSGDHNSVESTKSSDVIAEVAEVVEAVKDSLDIAKSDLDELLVVVEEVKLIGNDVEAVI